MERDQEGLRRMQGLLGLCRALPGLGDRRGQVGLDTAPLVEGLLLGGDDGGGLLAALEHLAVHLALDRLGLGDVVIQQLAQLEGTLHVLTCLGQSLGEVVRGGQPELRLSVGQLLVGGAYGVVGRKERG